MEKRVVIAFVLSILVMIIWSLLFAPKPEKVPPKKELTQMEEGKAIPDSADTPAAKPATVPKEEVKVLPKIKEQEIKVETPLYRAVLTSAGPGIKSFELKKYRKTTDPHSPFIELVNLGESGEDFLKIDFDHGSNPQPNDTPYAVDKTSISLDPTSSPQELTFRAVRPDGVSISQTYRFYPDKYQIDLLVNLLNQSENQIQGNFKAYVKNLPTQEKGYLAFVGLALLHNGKLKELKPKDKEIKEGENLSGRIGWIAYEDKYFMSAIIPEEQDEKDSFKGALLSSGVLRATYRTPSISLGSQETTSSRFTLYLGPRDLSVLKQTGYNLDLAINFGFFDIIARPLLSALRFFNQYVNNFGVSIIILTILIKILFWPLTHKSYKSMKEMQKLQPLMAKIREKYKNDKQQMNKELMGLYRTYKVNPMGGCLPMVIQIPVFIALYNLFGKSIELRHAPFMLWINDLSAPDRLFNFPFQIPFMSPPYGIPVLTLLMGATMFITQKMTPTPGDPTQAKVMMFLPLFFTFLFINFPAGLVLYWLVNNILQIGQQYRIKKSSA